MSNVITCSFILNMFRKNITSLGEHFSQISYSKSNIHHNQMNCSKISPKALFTIADTSLSSKFESFIQVCYDNSLIKQGQQVHAQIIINGVSNDSLVGTKILGMYALCGRISYAKNVFYKLELCYSLPWNLMIRGFTLLGWFDFALLFYFKMLGGRASPDKYTFPYVIKACNGLANVKLGKLVHDTIRLFGLEDDLYIGSSLIRLYVNKGYIDDARKLFDKISHRDCVLWNVMLDGYVKIEDCDNAICMFQKMWKSGIKPNSVTFGCVLSLCATKENIYWGNQLHGLAVRTGLQLESSVANTLLAMYSKCGHISEAFLLFDTLPRADLVTWNAMIGGCVQNFLMDEATRLFNEMICAGVKPDSITFSSFLPSVAESRNLRLGKEIHGYVLRHSVPLDIFLRSAIIDIYFKCGNVVDARKIFHQSSIVDIVVCTATISGYVLNGMYIDALNVFRWLIEEKISPNCISMASVLPACTNMASLKLGMELHAYILKKGFDGKCQVGCAVTDMYSKCGRLDLAHRFFDRMPERDAVCWNSMISSYSQNGKPEVAIELFCQMRDAGKKYDSVSMSAALSACANLPSQLFGKEIHGVVIRGGFTHDTFVESALIDMYSKCGNLSLAREVFNMMTNKNEVSWNNIISAYGSHGCLGDCLDTFEKMLKAGLKPDHVTFLSIISACGHAGNIDEGVKYFHCMTEEYKIAARMEHYSCLVDLYGRAGRLNEAFETIKSMPFAPDAGIWGTLLGACRVRGDVELAKVAATYLFDVDPQNSGYYVLLSNIHADAGEWQDVLRVRKLMKERGVHKIPGYSWIDVNNATHMFVSADGAHQHSDEIYLILETLILELKEEGYTPQLYQPRHPEATRSYGRKAMECHQSRQERIVNM